MSPQHIFQNIFSANKNKTYKRRLSHDFVPRFDRVLLVFIRRWARLRVVCRRSVVQRTSEETGATRNMVRIEIHQSQLPIELHMVTHNHSTPSPDKDQQYAVKMSGSTSQVTVIVKQTVIMFYFLLALEKFERCVVETLVRWRGLTHKRHYTWHVGGANLRIRLGIQSYTSILKLVQS